MIWVSSRVCISDLCFMTLAYYEVTDTDGSAYLLTEDVCAPNIPTAVSKSSREKTVSESTSYRLITLLSSPTFIPSRLTTSRPRSTSQEMSTLCLPVSSQVFLTIISMSTRDVANSEQGGVRITPRSQSTPLNNTADANDNRYSTATSLSGVSHSLLSRRT